MILPNVSYGSTLKDFSMIFQRFLSNKRVYERERLQLNCYGATRHRCCCFFSDNYLIPNSLYYFVLRFFSRDWFFFCLLLKFEILCYEFKLIFALQYEVLILNKNSIHVPTKVIAQSRLVRQKSNQK